MKKIITLALVMVMSVACTTAVMADDVVSVSNEEVVLTDTQEEVEEETETEEIVQEAAMDPAATSGTCGDEVSWSIEGNTLTISGSGAMTAYTQAADLPWVDSVDSINTVTVVGGVTSISAYAFANMTNLDTVNIPESVTSIGSNIFDGCTKSAITVYYAGNKKSWNNSVSKYDYDFEEVSVECQGTEAEKKFVCVNGVWGYYEGEDLVTTANGFVYGTINSEPNWWYCQNGICSLNYTDIIQANLDGENGWWYVKNGKFDNSTTVASNKYGWWYLKNGKVDFTHTGVEHNSNGWWKIEDGKVNFNFKGFASNSNGDWYLENGKVNFNKTDIIQGTLNGVNAWWRVVNSKVDYSETVAQNSNGWWYCKNGKVDFSYTGVAHNQYGWWKIEGGKVNFNFKGFASNSNGDWYLENGKVNFNKTDIIYGTVNGTSGWWNVVASKVNYSTTVAHNSNGWWCCRGGKVDFNYTGLASNSNGTWYCESGKVNFNRTLWVDGQAVYASKVVSDSGYFRMALKAQSYSSDTKYLLLVDCTNNYVGIFVGSKGKWVYRDNGYIRCCTGAAGTETIKGEFKLTTNRGYSFSGPDTGTPDYTCYYYSGFSGSYLFHSVLYNYNTWTVRDGTLGADVSHGCVRLATSEAKWIYENCPVGTTVVTYSNN